MAKAKEKIDRHVIKKKTRQGSGTFSKFTPHKRSKLYKKKYRGQGK